MHVKTFRRFPMLGTCQDKNERKENFLFVRRNSPNIVDWSCGGKKTRVPSGTNPSFRLPPWWVEGDPHLEDVQLVIPEMQCSFPVRSDYVTNIFTAAPLRTGQNSNRRPCQWLILSQHTLAPVSWAGVPHWGQSTVFASIDMVAMLQIFTWWDNRRIEV